MLLDNVFKIDVDVNTHYVTTTTIFEKMRVDIRRFFRPDDLKTSKITMFDIFYICRQGRTDFVLLNFELRTLGSKCRIQ